VPRLEKILDYMYYTAITLQPQQIFIGLVNLMLIADYYALADHAFAPLFSNYASDASSRDPGLLPSCELAM